MQAETWAAWALLITKAASRELLLLLLFPLLRSCSYSDNLSVLASEARHNPSGSEDERGFVFSREQAAAPNKYRTRSGSDRVQ